MCLGPDVATERLPGHRKWRYMVQSEWDARKADVLLCLDFWIECFSGRGALFSPEVFRGCRRRPSYVSSRDFQSVEPPKNDWAPLPQNHSIACTERTQNLFAETAIFLVVPAIFSRQQRKEKKRRNGVTHNFCLNSLLCIVFIEN